MARKKEQKLDRQRILDKTIYFDIDQLDGKTLEEVAMLFAGLHSKHEKEIVEQDIVFKFAADSYGYDGGVDFNIQVWRHETDEEYADRLQWIKQAQEKEAKAREAKKEKARKELMRTVKEEREEYERLKAKFEGAN